MTTLLQEPETLKGIGHPEPHRWSHEEYNRLGDAGFFRGQRVELIEGKIFDLAPQRNDHAITIELVADALRMIFKSGYRVRVQLPMLLSASQPEPDLAVLAGKPRDSKHHPATALLVVEVADTTLQFDRDIKAKLYAAAGLPEYWIVNLIDRCVEVYRNPVVSGGVAAYEPAQTFSGDNQVASLAAPGQVIPVSELLP